MAQDPITTMKTHHPCDDLHDVLSLSRLMMMIPMTKRLILQTKNHNLTHHRLYKMLRVPHIDRSICHELIALHIGLAMHGVSRLWSK